MSMGLYLDALVLQHEVTGEATHLQRARRMWAMIERVFAASQVYGPGSFLRPYGGFLNMGKSRGGCRVERTGFILGGGVRLKPVLRG